MEAEPGETSPFHVFDTTPIGVFVLDAEYRILFWNKCLENWTGISRSEILNQDARPRFPILETPGYSRRIKDVFRSGVPAVFSPQLHPPLIPCESKPGVLRVQYITVTAIPNRPHGGFLAVFSIQDITDLTQRLAESRTTAQRLAEELKERTVLEKDLYQAKEVAEAASRAKGQFLALMSHEMRTPLHGVLGMTELIMDTDLSREQREMMETIDDSGRLLLSLINEILDLAKIEAGRLLLERVEFDLSRLAEDAIKLVKPQARRKGLRLFWQVDPQVGARVEGDPTRLRQVVLNLLSNAVKFTDSGEVVLRISPECSQDHGERVVFEVTDTGIGIDAGALDRLFEPFVQADLSTTRRYGGTGLGLTVCKCLVELMGGAVGVESKPGRGSRFWFAVALPCVTPAVQDPSQPNLADFAAPVIPRRLLVADDNTVNQTVTAKMLERLGYQVDIVANGAEAVDAVRSTEYGAVLMDCFMPVMDGYQATAEIRRLAHYCRTTPIIALTANSGSEAREQSLAAGMDDYLTKPMSLRSLADALERVLKTRPL